MVALMFQATAPQVAPGHSLTWGGRVTICQVKPQAG